ncbi:protein-glutamine glutaminase family protein [Bdellovibrionota bacterium FG-1]
MCRFLTFLSILLTSPWALADTVTTRVVDTELLEVSPPGGVVTTFSVLSTADGRVYTVAPESTKLVEKLRKSSGKNRKPVHLKIRETGDDDEIIGVAPLTPTETEEYQDPVQDPVPSEVTISETETEIPTSTVSFLPPSLAKSPVATPAPTREPLPEAMQEANSYGYQPTVFGSMSDAQQLFSQERQLDHNSQCHNRAMVWTYDWYRYQGTRSMKVMMFFTKRFQNTYVRWRKGFFGNSVKPYKWWYHTAPFVYVGNQEVVIDQEFCPGPLTVDQWSQFFLSDIIHQWTTILREQHASGADHDYLGYLLDGDSRIENPATHTPLQLVNRLTPAQTHCRVLKNYRDSDHPTAEDWCLARKVPMYYTQPDTIQGLDCDPRIDSYGDHTSAERFPDGRLKYPCLHTVLTDFDMKAVKRAYKDANPDGVPDWLDALLSH